MDYNWQKERLTKTLNFEIVSSSLFNTSGRDDLFQARKAGEDVRQASGSGCTKRNSVEGHQVDMWVNKSNGGDKKHQYFGQFRGKELKKVDSNTQG